MKSVENRKSYSVLYSHINYVLIIGIIVKYLLD